VSVCVCVCLIDCGKIAEQILMPFGVVVQVGSRICRLDGGADHPMVRDNIQGGCGAAYCKQVEICGVVMRE